MIATTLVVGAAMVLVQAPLGAVERGSKAYVSCLRGLQKKSLEAKMEPAAFNAAVKTSCSAESATLRSALIALSMANGAKRAKAESDAARDLAAYAEEIEAGYADEFAALPSG